jgi:hypothetical protein
MKEIGMLYGGVAYKNPSEGVTRSREDMLVRPCASGIMTGSPPNKTPTTDLVFPRSMPMVLLFTEPRPTIFTS